MKFDFKFIPPDIPIHGGTWESIFKMIKRVLHVLVDKSTMKYYTFQTLLEVTTGVVNRRPLKKLTYDDPKDLSVLMPESFIALGIVEWFSSALLPPRPVGSSMLWSAAAEMQSLLDAMWRRWTREYVVKLQRRQKLLF